MNEPYDYIWVGKLERKMQRNSTLYVAYFVGDAYYFAVEWANSLDDLEDKVYRFIELYHRDLKTMKITKDQNGKCTEEYLPGYTVYKYKEWKKSHKTFKSLEPEPFI